MHYIECAVRETEEVKLQDKLQFVKIFSIPYEISLCLIDHRLIVHHVCVVAKGIVREQFLIFD